jgi:nitroimidazol reductase NimA-like FMN-containing flavoprotein (pyridoxamine 5'-phosphate oxidase superfamily)
MLVAARDERCETEGDPDMSEEYRGAMGGLRDADLEAFLASDALARVACLRADGSPYVVPMWHQWDGTSFWFVGRERSEWCKMMEADPRVAVVIDKEHGRPDSISGEIAQIPKVMTSGRVEIVERPNVGGKWVEIAAKMALRYLGDNGPSYLESTLKQPRWLIRLTPDEIKTWKGVGWAKRYWVDSTGGPSFEEAHGLTE